MLKITEDSTLPNLISTVAVNKLDQADYEQLVPILKNKLNGKGKIRWYFAMEDFKGWTPGAAWEDFKFDIQHAGDFEKIAMVGEKEWQEWLTALMKPFTSAELRFFETKDEEEARRWIRS